MVKRTLLDLFGCWKHLLPYFWSHCNKYKAILSLNSIGIGTLETLSKQVQLKQVRTKNLLREFD